MTSFATTAGWDVSLYTRCYCEENAYNLCRAIKDRAGIGQTQGAGFENARTFLASVSIENAYVVFCSSEIGWFAMNKQKAGKEESDGEVVWDYHVFVVVKHPTHGAMVYDFDTTLSFPCPFVTYVGASFKPSRLPRSFRVIPAHDYLSFFASDRRHMRVDAGAVSDESWIAPPPSAPAISSLVVFDSSTYKVPQYDPEAAEYWGNAHRTPATNEHRLSLYIRMTKATTDWERIAENALVDQYLGKIVDLVGLPRYFQIGSVCCASEG